MASTQVETVTSGADKAKVAWPTMTLVGVLGGLFVALPFILWQLWLFIAPGLYAHEKRFAIPFVLFASIFFFGGAWTDEEPAAIAAAVLEARSRIDAGRAAVGTPFDAVYVAGEAKDAQRNAPRALWMGTIIVAVLYVALNAAFYAAEVTAHIRGPY